MPEDQVVVQAAENSDYKIDLRLLNAEVNASAHSDNSIIKLKQNIRGQPGSNTKTASRSGEK